MSDRRVSDDTLIPGVAAFVLAPLVAGSMRLVARGVEMIDAGVTSGMALLVAGTLIFMLVWRYAFVPVCEGEV